MVADQLIVFEIDAAIPVLPPSLRALFPVALVAETVEFISYRRGWVVLEIGEGGEEAGDWRGSG